MITEAEAQLRVASARGRIGRYQLEAAIQSIHAHRAVSGVIDWAEIALLYDGLIGLTPTTGAHVGRAVALAESGHIADGLAALDALPTQHTTSYAPWWAARAPAAQTQPPRRGAAGVRAGSEFEHRSRASRLLDRERSVT